MKKYYSFLVVCTLLFCYTGNVWGASPVTIADGTTTNQYHPFYGAYCDQYVRSQMIYPTSMLTEIKDKQLDGMTFYLKSALSTAWTSNFQVYLSEVTASNYDESTAWNTESVTKVLVYEGTLSGTTGTVPITFSTPYTYAGGNLMVEIKSTSKGNYITAYFYGKSMSNNTSVYGKNASSTTFNANGRSKFLAKVAIAYSESSSSSSCKKPLSLALSSITNTSATFTWEAGGEETSWQYICLPSDTDLDWDDAAVKTATSATATVNNLSPNSTYKFYVRSYCAVDEQSDQATKEFITACAPYATSSLPYTTGFESSDCAAGEMPDCWRRISTNDYPAANTTAPKTGSQSLRLYGNKVQYAILPPFEADVKNLMVSFYYRNAFNSSSSPQLIVGYMTDPNDASTFVPVETMSRITTYNSDKSEVDMSDADGAGAHYIAFKYTESSFSTMDWINVDDIEVDILGTCFKPASIADASSITSDGATLSWTASGHGETTYQWAVAEGSADPVWVDDAAHKVSGTSKALTGLESNTNYTFYVRSYCAADDQSEAVSKAFTTACGVESLPFEYGFENATNVYMPSCWNAHYASGYGAYAYTTNPHTGSKSLNVTAPKTAGSETVVVLPEIDAALNKLGVTFFYRGTAGASIEVGYVTNPNNKATFVKVGDAITVAASYKEAFVSFESLGSVSGNVALRFKGVSDEAYFYIDDIRVARTVTLADNVDNSSLISSLAAEGETIDILLKRKIWMDGYYNTLCLPFSLSADQLADVDCPLNNFNLKVFDYTRTENEEVHMYITGASSIEAGVPYFASYQGTPTSDKTEHLFRDVKVTATSAGEKTSEIVTYKGFYTQTVLANQSENASPVIFYLSRNNTIYWPDQDVTLNGFRAYFAVDYSAGAPARPIRRICFADQQEDTATGITGTNSGVTTVKRVENNQVIIIRDGVKFTILGQKIQ